jgi:hypothetical protein
MPSKCTKVKFLWKQSLAAAINDSNTPFDAHEAGGKHLQMLFSATLN